MLAMGCVMLSPASTSPILAQCQLQKLTASDAGSADRFGGSVSISGDVAVVGAWGDRCSDGSYGCGAAYLFRLDGAQWVEQSKLIGFDLSTEAFFGAAVAADDPDRMSGDARSIDRNRLLRERVAEVATRRGIPVLFPLLDTEDLESISFTDIWGGFDDLLLQASARYDADSVLVGRIRPDSRQSNRWSWYFDGDRASWNGQTEDMINLLADSLAARSIVDPTSPVETIRLTIHGIDSVNAFGRVQQLMDNLRGIEEIMIHTVTGDRIVYEVQIQGGTDRLKRALELSKVLEPVDQFDDGIEVVPFDDSRNPFETFDSRGPRRTTLEYLYLSD